MKCPAPALLKYKDLLTGITNKTGTVDVQLFDVPPSSNESNFVRIQVNAGMFLRPFSHYWQLNGS
jgi:hypothetical protein